MLRLVSGFTLGPLTLLIVYFGGWVFALFLLCAAALALYEWGWLALRSPRAVFLLLGGAFYICLSFGACYALRDAYGVWPTILCFGMVWFSDIGAYFTGKLLGGPKMAGRISPNKTWAGYVGALFSPVLPALFFMPALWALVIGLAIGVTGQAGDLLVSWLKRHVGAKDTGNLIPGHGGLLDRIDSLMLSVPVYLAFAKFVF